MPYRSDYKIDSFTSVKIINVSLVHSFLYSNFPEICRATLPCRWHILHGTLQASLSMSTEIIL